MFAANIEYPVLAHNGAGAEYEHIEHGFQVGVLAVRDLASDIVCQPDGTSPIKASAGSYGVDYMPARRMICFAGTLDAALVIADTLSLTAPEAIESIDQLARWVSPYAAWVQAVVHADARALPLPTFRDFIAGGRKAA